MLKRILKSKWVWLALLVAAAGVYLYFTGTLSKWTLELRIRFGKERTFDEALQDQTTKEWDYTTDPVTANIWAIDEANQTLLLSFVYPPKFITQAFGGGETTQNTKVTCTAEKSSYYVTRLSEDPNEQTGETKLIQSNINIFQFAKVGDTFIGLCNDQNCTEIRQTCEIHSVIAP